MNRFKRDAIWSVVVYAIATLVVFGGAKVWADRTGSDDGLHGLVYVVPGSMAVVGALVLTASVVTLFLGSLRAAKIGQMVSAVPHLVPFVVYGLVAVLFIRADGIADEGGAALVVSLVVGAVAHAGWFGYAVRRTTEPAGLRV